MNSSDAPAMGDNIKSFEINAEVRMFNSITRFAGREGRVRKLTLPPGTEIKDVLRRLCIPPADVFLIFVNGRDITPTLGDVRTTYEIEDGDVIALSGPVPYSWGYGAPIV